MQLRLIAVRIFNRFAVWGSGRLGKNKPHHFDTLSKWLVGGLIVDILSQGSKFHSHFSRQQLHSPRRVNLHTGVAAVRSGFDYFISGPSAVSLCVITASVYQKCETLLVCSIGYVLCSGIKVLTFPRMPIALSPVTSYSVGLLYHWVPRCKLFLLLTWIKVQLMSLEEGNVEAHSHSLNRSLRTHFFIVDTKTIVFIQRITVKWLTPNTFSIQRFS